MRIITFIYINEKLDKNFHYVYNTIINDQNTENMLKIELSTIAYFSLQTGIRSGLCSENDENGFLNINSENIVILHSYINFWDIF